MRVDTVASNYHTVVAVFSGAPGALSRIGCSDTAFDPTRPPRFDEDVTSIQVAGLAVPVNAGTNYWIEIGDGTEPDDVGQDEQEYDTGDDLPFPEGGLLNVTVSFGGKRRGVKR